MARNLSYFMDPDEEERLRLLEQEFGPPAPPAHPNLGVARVPPLPLDDMPRRTDRDYSDFHDAYQDQDPAEEELAADAAHEEGGYEQIAPAAGDRVAPPEEAHPLDVFLTDPGRAANPYEEEAQAYAKEQKQAAPRPVDDKAASVADEQKGVPAASKLATTIDTDDELAWADDLLGQVRKRVLDKPEASESALHKTAEGAIEEGLRPKKAFSKEEQSRLALDAYGEESPPSTRWEDELLKERGDDRLTDAQIRRRSAAMNLVLGLTTGDMTTGTRWADQQRRSNEDFTEARAKARDRDKQGTRISRGLAAAIAASGVPPEEAVKLTYGDPLVKAFSSGMYSQGGRAEGQAIGLQKAQLHEAVALYNSGNADDRIRAMGMFSGLVQLGTAEVRAQALSQLSPEDQQKLGAAWMSSSLRALGVNLSPEKAAAVLEGDRTDLPPKAAAKADELAPQIKAGVKDNRTRPGVIASNLKENVNAEVKSENKVRESILLAQNDRDKALEWQGKWRAAEVPLKEGLQAWRKMSPKAKEAFATLSTRGEIVDQLAKFAMYGPGEQALASKVLAVINAHVKADAGSAVTGSEWDRIAYRVGIPTGTWAPFNDPAVVESYLMDAAKLMTESRKDYERIMGGWK